MRSPYWQKRCHLDNNNNNTNKNTLSTFAFHMHALLLALPYREKGIARNNYRYPRGQTKINWFIVSLHGVKGKRMPRKRKDGGEKRGKLPPKWVKMSNIERQGEDGGHARLRAPIGLICLQPQAGLRQTSIPCRETKKRNATIRIPHHPKAPTT